MIRGSRVLMIAGMALLSACATGFVSTWKAPDAAPLELAGQKVAAVVMVKSETSRRAAEDTLAREITARGAQGLAMYALAPNVVPSKETEAETRALLEKAGVAGVVVMRPVSVDKQMVATTVTSIDPMYRGYWGGYYGYGWASPYGAAPMTTNQTELRLDTVVSVETLVFSLKQNKLVWSGKSETTNPAGVDKQVKELAAMAAKELQKQGLIK